MSVSIKRRIVVGLMLVLSSLTAQAEHTVEHEVGTLTLPAAPQRIVVLEYSFIDALATMGVSPVGVADDLNPQRIIPAVRTLLAPWTSVGMRSQPSLEIIAQLKPDLIIADLHRHRVSYDDLSKIAPTMLLKSRGESYQDALDSALLIGKALDKEQLMQARIAQHKALMATYQGKFNDVGTVQFANVNDRGMWMHGPLSFTGSLFESLGLESGIADLKKSYLMQVNFEVLLQVNPDWLFYGKKQPGSVLDTWQQSPLFRLLKIDKTGQFKQVSSALWSLNRGMLAAEGIAKELDLILNHSNES
ncbi:MAG: ABC transporter substrate-binding protein [Gammaproteobacteria bacterium]|nr:ABC transporter substrate-binding protein [Gammaproteobacteria bacterium]